MEKTITNVPLILIAEDDMSNYLLCEFLLKKSYHLLHANNGAEAIELFKAYAPEMILMDIKMPVMDGFEATAEIRKLSSTIPIIAVTAYAHTKEKEKILNNGFSAYISKPLEIAELKKMILNLLDKSFPPNK